MTDASESDLKKLKEEIKQIKHLLVMLESRLIKVERKSIVTAERVSQHASVLNHGNRRT